MKKILIIVVLFSLGLVSWKLYPSKYEQLMKPVIEAKNKDPNITIDGEIEPPFPDKVENNKTILGVDINNNGVRDDVEIWINRTFKHQDQRKALKQYAKSYIRELVEAPKLDKKLSFELTQETEAAFDCTMRIFIDQNNFSDVDQATHLNALKNVEILIRHPSFRDKSAFLRHNLLAGQMVGGLDSSQKSPHLYCKFQVELK